jgi:hypothetical protein
MLQKPKIQQRRTHAVGFPHITVHCGSVHCEALSTWIFFTWKIGKIGKSKEFFTLWLFNIAMENGPSMDDLPVSAYYDW